MNMSASLWTSTSTYTRKVMLGSSLETIVSGREVNLYMTKLAKKISRYFMSEVVVANPPSNDLKAEE